MGGKDFPFRVKVKGSGRGNVGGRVSEGKNLEGGDPARTKMGVFVKGRILEGQGGGPEGQREKKI